MQDRGRHIASLCKIAYRWLAVCLGVFEALLDADKQHFGSGFIPIPVATLDAASLMQFGARFLQATGI